MEWWKPVVEELRERGGGSEAVGTPTPRTSPKPGGGFVIPPGAPPPPDRRDYSDDQFGTENFQADYIAWVDIIYALGGGMPEEPAAADPSRLAEIEAANQRHQLSLHTEATIAAVDAEIAAGNLTLAQAEAAFNARMDAFEAAGQQQAEMWKWTVPKGSAGKPLHKDIREGLGMRPWISQPVEFDPWAMAEEIVDSMAEPSPVPNIDPILDLVGGFTG